MNDDPGVASITICLLIYLGCVCCRALCSCEETLQPEFDKLEPDAETGEGLVGVEDQVVQEVRFAVGEEENKELVEAEGPGTFQNLFKDALKNKQ